MKMILWRGFGKIGLKVREVMIDFSKLSLFDVGGGVHFSSLTIDSVGFEGEGSGKGKFRKGLRSGFKGFWKGFGDRVGRSP